MKNIICYKEYSGVVDFDEKKGMLTATVVGTKASLVCHGASVESLVNNFHKTIDIYLKECQNKEIEPEHPFKGSFNVRVSPYIHKQAYEFAISHNISLNTLVNNALRCFLQEQKKNGE